MDGLLEDKPPPRQDRRLEEGEPLEAGLLQRLAARAIQTAGVEGKGQDQEQASLGEVPVGGELAPSPLRGP